MAVQVAFINTTGEIQQWCTPRVDTDFVEGVSYNGLIAVHLPNDTDMVAFAKTNVYQNGQWATRPTKPDAFHNWNGVEWVFEADRFDSALRAQRNNKLYLSDWTQTADAPLTAEKKEEWRLYRQALRDIPEINEATTLEDIAWPSQP